jgi:glutathione peroxidase
MAMMRLQDFTVRDIAGAAVSLDRFHGKVVLAVNTASQCGFTPQYAGLEKLYRDLADQGFVILGFPCNQFGAQEPAQEPDIAVFCREKYAVSCPLFAKIDVNGPGADPLFDWLKTDAPGILGSRSIKWNFTKFLIDRDGRCIARFAPFTRPEKLRRRIEALLG